MKPVFVSDSLGCLYQSGARKLNQMRPEQRAFIARDLSLAVAVSPHMAQDFPVPVTVHLPFGDNKQWAGPSRDLAGTITAAARLLRQGDHVMTYCYYGVNRSGLVCALIIRELLGCTGSDALARLRMARKGSIGGNPHFVDYLNQLGQPVGSPREASSA